MTGASDTPEPRRITVKSPIDGKTVGELVVTDPRDVQDVVDRARVAFERWSVLTHRDRRPSLRAFTGAVLSNMDRIASMISSRQAVIGSSSG